MPRRLLEAGDFTKADLPAVKAYAKEAARLMLPAPDAEAVKMLDRLFKHYPQTHLHESEHADRWDDWLDDLEDVPLDVLDMACTRWRRSTQRFAPTPGQLLDKVSEILFARKVFAKRAAELAELLEGA